MELSNRRNFVPSTPYRKKRPSTAKIIFLSCEGAVTEEEYFSMISDMFHEAKSKIQFISVMEDAVNTLPKFRTPDQNKEISKNKPKQLVEKIDKFKNENNLKFDLDKHPDDEFWIIADVDDHTDDNNIDEWNEALATCEEKGYGYAISNPFFELWLLIHHVDVNEEDYKYAVTEEHHYEKTGHFRIRLRKDAKAQLKEQKHIVIKHYDREKVKNAIIRARDLHNKAEKWPSNLGSTVYILLEKIQELCVE
ncbi:RloB family protein [Anaerosporobacter sp.]|uniref:RloB family protein n=1 Tax=Anaerosporobacter sp. TaxID=1872529 RepID=UPI00286F07CA|nr:RloB family protein [Anaerosporobacter sp.]